MAHKGSCVTNEWYHCYNRGVDKRVVFDSKGDYERFVTLLYTCNGTKPVRISDSFRPDLLSFFHRNIDRGDSLVEIGAYACMPTHVHLVLKQLRDGGIASFMQRLFTGYTMYFNLKQDRTGALFAGTYKSKHVADDRYFKQLIAYVLLNPVELFERDQKQGVGDLKRLDRQLRTYSYSSLPDFFGEKRPQNKIVSNLNGYYDARPPLATMLSDALAYYQEQPSEV